MTDPADQLGFGRASADYEPVEPGRWRPPWSSAAVTGLTAAGALLVGFLLTTGMSAGREVAIAQGERKDELIELITERQDRTDELTAELDDLRARLGEAQREAAAGLPALRQAVTDAEFAAGLVDLRGQGVRLTLRDASGNCPAEPFACKIQDVDVQLALNALFAAGAEAVAVGGERVVSTTAVRSAGQTVLVNLTVLTSPYELVAVGDADQVYTGVARSRLAQDFAQWEQQYGLGFELERASEVVVPRYTGSVGLEATAQDPG